jgi:hypothetical protein
MGGYERELRIAVTESTFREANESLHSVFADDAEESPFAAYPFVCECGDRTCTGVLLIPLAVYEQVRGHPTRFLILRGHKQLGSERVVDQADGYEVIEKIGAAGEIARADWSQLTRHSV